MVRRLAGTALVFVLANSAVVNPCAAAGLPPHTIFINHWPEDVPCNVLKKYPDGTYEMTVPFVLYYQIHLSAKYKNLGVTRYWDRKCRGLTK